MQVPDREPGWGSGTEFCLQLARDSSVLAEESTHARKRPLLIDAGGVLGYTKAAFNPRTQPAYPLIQNGNRARDSSMKTAEVTDA